MPYFVAYLLEKKVYVALPVGWIYDIDSQHENFINNSINRGKTFTCFYPDELSRFFINGRPDENYDPDFTTDIFDCKLTKFFGK